MDSNKFATLSVLFAATISTSLLAGPAQAYSAGMEATGQVSQPNAPNYILAQSRKAFTVTKIWSNSIYVKSSATGNVYEVSYAGRIGAEVGDTVTVIINEEDDWVTIINERTGKSAAVTSVSRV